MPSLHIKSEETGQAWQIWPSPETIPPGIIQEACSYIFELKDAVRASETDLLIDDVPLEALRSRGPGTARWRWQTGFHAGEVSAELRQPGHRPIRFEVVSDPDRSKLTRSDFDTMLVDIMRDSFALFSLSNFHRGIAHGTKGRPPSIARLEYLRSRINELERIVREIERRPRRHLRSEERMVPYHQVRRATGSEVIRSLARGQAARVSKDAAGLPQALRGFVPTEFRIRYRYSSLDIPEHRQMASVMATWEAWLRASAEQLVKVELKGDPETPSVARLWAHRCRRLARRLHTLRQAEPFTDLPPAPPQLQLSSLFRSDPNYRKFYKLYQDFNLGLASIFGDFLDLPLARTFELYELWCFLRLVRAAAIEFGPSAVDLRTLFTRDAAGGLTIAASAVTVKVSQYWDVMFQKRYEEFWKAADGRGSFSRTMTPDIVLAGHSGSDTAQTQLIVLDAKYRIDASLNDAISSIHTYRDALVEDAGGGQFHGIVQAAYILTPHIPQPEAKPYQKTAMPGRLFHPGFRSTFHFGAASLKPGSTLSETCDCLRALIADATGKPQPP